MDPETKTTDNRDKHRLRFRKHGELRFLSHHDLMRTLERALRRAELPYRVTAGFHPKPRLILVMSLPLGCEGRDEALELELFDEVEPAEVLGRLRGQSPGGLDFHSARRIPTNLTGMPRRAVYRLPLPPARAGAAAAACAAVSASEELWVARTHPKPREVNIRPYLRDLRVLPAEGGAAEPLLEMDVWVTPTGSARADEAAAALGLRDLLGDGRPLTRARLELHDEAGDGAEPAPDIPRLPTRPLSRPAEPEPETEPTAAGPKSWGQSADRGPVVE